MVNFVIFLVLLLIPIPQPYKCVKSNLHIGDSRPFVRIAFIGINGKKIEKITLIDTGADVNSLDTKTAEEIGVDKNKCISVTIIGAHRESKRLLCLISHMEIGSLVILSSKIVLNSNKKYPSVGTPFLKKLKLKFDFTNNKLCYKE